MSASIWLQILSIALFSEMKCFKLAKTNTMAFTVVSDSNIMIWGHLLFSHIFCLSQKFEDVLCNNTVFFHISGDCRNEGLSLNTHYTK